MPGYAGTVFHPARIPNRRIAKIALRNLRRMAAVEMETCRAGYPRHVAEDRSRDRIAGRAELSSWFCS